MRADRTQSNRRVGDESAPWLFVAYGVPAVAAVVGFVWLTVAIARGKTLYPRWVAFANPLVCMGIGLSVSRSIIERHHGRPWAEPNDGGPGATFSFWIPRQGQSLEAAPVASTS